MYICLWLVGVNFLFTLDVGGCVSLILLCGRSNVIQFVFVFIVKNNSTPLRPITLQRAIYFLLRCRRHCLKFILSYVKSTCIVCLCGCVFWPAVCRFWAAARRRVRSAWGPAACPCHRLLRVRAPAAGWSSMRARDTAGILLCCARSGHRQTPGTDLQRKSSFITMLFKFTDCPITLH